MTPKKCAQHPLEQLRVFDSKSTSWDDHDTTYGQCAACGAFLVVTEFKTDRAPDVREMHSHEIVYWRSLLAKEMLPDPEYADGMPF